MNQTIVNILIIVVIALIVFLTIRFVLQMIFLRECPHCGKTVSLAEKRECPNCGYVFLKNRHAKLNLTIALLIMAIALFVFLDIHLFRKKTSDYLRANPYLWRGEVTTSEEMTTETGELSEEAPQTDAVPEEVPEATPEMEVVPEEVLTPEAVPEATPEMEAAPEEVPTPEAVPEIAPQPEIAPEEAL